MDHKKLKKAWKITHNSCIEHMIKCCYVLQQSIKRQISVIKKAYTGQPNKKREQYYQYLLRKNLFDQLNKFNRALVVYALEHGEFKFIRQIPQLLEIFLYASQPNYNGGIPYTLKNTNAITHAAQKGNVSSVSKLLQTKYFLATTLQKILDDPKVTNQSIKDIVTKYINLQSNIELTHKERTNIFDDYIK